IRPDILYARMQAYVSLASGNGTWNARQPQRSPRYPLLLSRTAGKVQAVTLSGMYETPCSSDISRQDFLATVFTRYSCRLDAKEFRRCSHPRPYRSATASGTTHMARRSVGQSPRNVY